MKVAVIVEGDGDIRAFPSLVAKIGEVVEIPVFAPQPIRAGGYLRLRKAGQLERYLEMAARRDDVDLILVSIDIDDHCPVEFFNEFNERAKPIIERFGVPVEFRFCVREYECFFLDLIEELAAATPEYGWLEVQLINNPQGIRGAKERLQRHMTKHYKEIIDQEVLTKKLDLKILYSRNRAFRRMVNAITGLGYDQLGARFAL